MYNTIEPTCYYSWVINQFGSWLIRGVITYPRTRDQHMMSSWHKNTVLLVLCDGIPTVYAPHKEQIVELPVIWDAIEIMKYSHHWDYKIITSMAFIGRLCNDTTCSKNAVYILSWFDMVKVKSFNHYASEIFQWHWVKRIELFYCWWSNAGPLFTKKCRLTLRVKWISIINLRRSDDHLRFTMGIHTPIRRCLLNW